MPAEVREYIVADEWKINSVYVRGSKIYVRRPMDLRTWSLRLRAWIEKYHYGKLCFSSRKCGFSLCRINKIAVEE